MLFQERSVNHSNKLKPSFAVTVLWNVYNLTGLV